MKRVVAAIWVIFLLASAPAWAHRIDEYLQATVLSLSVDRARASMRLIPGVLIAPAVIAAIDSDGDGVLSDDEQRAYAQRVLDDTSLTLNGQAVQPELLYWSFASPAQMRAGLGEIHIEYWVNLPHVGPDRHLILENHYLNRASVYLMNVLVPDDSGLHIFSQKRNAQQSLYELDYRQIDAVKSIVSSVPTNNRVWLNGFQFGSFFRLGMHHIAQGTDHLLFLMTLLLPAPLLAAGARWGPPAAVRQGLLRVLGIVTAFTIGHSLTLGLSALDVIRLPNQPIEVLIAVSIFVSAIHAWRPVVAGKEVWIAGFFGLVHGVAFADTLDRLGLDHWQRVASILAFNLGIEAMQLGVVAAIMPSLILLSRKRGYSALRIGGSVFAGAASLGWIVERLFDLSTPVDSIVAAIAADAPWLVIALFLISIPYRSLSARAKSSLATYAGQSQRQP